MDIATIRWNEETNAPEVEMLIDFGELGPAQRRFVISTVSIWVQGMWEIERNEQLTGSSGETQP